jgi:hypothetical protein
VYLRVVGMQADLDGSSRTGRAFTEAEEDEFINMAREPDFFEKFSNSVAPSIYGHPGLFTPPITSRYQKGNHLSLVWWLEKDPT